MRSVKNWDAVERQFIKFAKSEQDYPILLGFKDLNLVLFPTGFSFLHRD